MDRTGNSPARIVVGVDGSPSSRAALSWALRQVLVLGSRGLGGFVGATLGSVSQHCVQHATCPVVIVRDQER